MLCYWILRRPDGTPAGLVRVQNDRVTLKPTVPIEGRFTLFSGTDAVPIVPERETVLPRAEALLGTDGDRETCFAAAENAAPLAAYRKRLSRFYTIKAQKAVPDDASAPDELILSHAEDVEVPVTPEAEESADDISHFRTIQSDSISDSAQKVQAFSTLLQRAEAFYSAYEDNASASCADNMVQNRDMQAEVGIDLFSQEYPGARWRYVDGSGVLPHYEGTWTQPNGQTLHILAVRGYAAPRPPRALLGFTRFLRDRDGTGYWLRLTPLG